jgi:uncharacterized protein (TIGR02646 family)
MGFSMRPVDRGPIPNDPDGNPKVFAEYADARADLFLRIGRYCSFCERPIKAGLAVEHVHHKDAYPDLERVWNNFLLACVNCNATKGTREVRRKQLVFPDQDNTFRALAYSVGGRVSPNPTLTPTLKGKATRLIKLVGLQRAPTKDPQAKDLRWNDRREAWDKAVRYRTKYEQGGIAVETLVDLCMSDGHWSIWMTVFDRITDIRLALIAAFPGIRSANCFDAFGNPVVRPNGQV